MVTQIDIARWESLNEKKTEWGQYQMTGSLLNHCEFDGRWVRLERECGMESDVTESLEKNESSLDGRCVRLTGYV